MKSRISLLIILLALLDSCRVKQFDLTDSDFSEWKPTAALPLFETNVSVNDMMAQADKNSVVKVDPDDGFVTLVFRGKFFEFSTSNLVPLPPVAKTLSFDVPGGVFPASGVVTISKELTAEIGDGSNEIYEIWLKGGAIKFSTGNPNGYLAKIKMSSDQVKNNNVPLLIEAGLGSSIIHSFAGSKIKLLQEGGRSVMKIKVELVMAGNSGDVYSAGKVDVDFLMSQLTYERVYLDIKPRKAISLQDSFPIPFFELKNVSGGIEFLQPKLRFYTANSYGGSATLKIESMQGKNSNGETKNVIFDPGANELVVNKPAFPGGVQEDAVDLKMSQSFSDVMAISPEVFYFNNSVYLNDDGADTNFILDTSRVRFSTQLELPLQLKFREFNFGPTVDVNLGDLFLTNFEFIKFKFETINKFPVELRFQLIFLDNNEQVLDSLFSGGSTIFKSGVVEANGRVEKDEIQRNEIILTKDKALVLQRASRMQIIFGFNTFDKGKEWVKFYDDYRIGIKCNLLVKGSINQ